MVCCRCNRSGSCKGCICVKKGRRCSGCLPSRCGRCSNSVGDCHARDADDDGVTVLASSAAPPVVASPPPVNTTTGSSSSQSIPSLSPVSSPPDALINALPSLDSILCMRPPTLHHVPKAARDGWAQIVGDVLSSVVSSPSDVGVWCKFFMLARCILISPPRGGRSHWRDTLKLIRSRIQKWREGKFLELWSDVAAADSRLKLRHLSQKSKCSPESLRRVNSSRARQAVEDGEYRKAIQYLTSSGLAQVSTDVVNEMVIKHPSGVPPSFPSDSVPSPVEVAEANVIKALRSFPTGTAPGPSGLRANHLKEAVFCPSPDRANYAVLSLTKLINLLCAGATPPAVSPHLCGASLFPCKKKDGGLRPIAVGEVLRRLTSKCVAKAVQSEALRVLAPLQVGVGVPAGCEAIVHSMADVLEDSSIPPEGRFTLLVDFSNAFNSVDRGAMFREVRSRIPSMAAWIENCYGSQPILHLGEQTILSSCGVQQGDPLGPLGFALALHPIVEKIKEKVPGLLINVWYLDDGTLCGSLDDLAAALTIIEDEGPALGLHLNRSKCLIHSIADTPINNPSLANIPIVSGGFDLLGAPLGSTAYCEATFLKRVNKVQDILTKLCDLQDSQMEATLLRSCLSLPKVMYVLRTCPPDFIERALEVYDGIMREALSDMCGSPLPDWAWLKASLPPSLGGLNLRRGSLHAPAAYIGSLYQSKPLILRILGRPLTNIYISQVQCQL